MKFILLIFSLFIFSTTLVIGQVTVYVESGEFGRGILKPRGAECFAIVPLHVVEDDMNEIKIIGEKNVATKGELIQSAGNDLAILRTNLGGELYCEDWQVDGNFDRLLSNVVEGVLEIRQNDGGSKLMQIFISEKNETNITIEPKRANQFFSKGMSGSAFYAIVNGEKKCLGMLMEVDVENNQGYVLQIDDILSSLESFYNLERTQKTEKKVEEIKNKGIKSRSNSRYPVYKKDNLSIQIETCLQKGNKVQCKLLLVNSDRDFYLEMIGRHRIKYSIMYDEKGNEYYSSYVKLANSGSEHEAAKKLIANVPVEGEIFFDVNKEIELITKLEVGFYYNGKRSRLIASWRNIQIDEKKK